MLLHLNCTTEVTGRGVGEEEEENRGSSSTELERSRGSLNDARRLVLHSARHGIAVCEILVGQIANYPASGFQPLGKKKKKKKDPGMDFLPVICFHFNIHYFLWTVKARLKHVRGYNWLANGLD